MGYRPPDNIEVLPGGRKVRILPAEQPVEVDAEEKPKAKPKAEEKPEKAEDSE